MTTSPIGIGVIGLGVMGRTHVAAVQAAERAGLPCRLVAVADARIERKLDEAPSVPHYPNITALLADPAVDAVSICTPTDSHVEFAVTALGAGKHVLVEKPVALRAADVARVADAARQAARVCMPAMCMRFWPGWEWLKHTIETKVHGSVRSAVFQRLGSLPDWSPFYADFDRSGGTLFDLHIHDADFIRHALGEPVEVVSTGTLAHVTTIYRFGPDGPPHVVAEAGQDHAPGFVFRMRYVVNFEHATADWDLSRDPQLLLVKDRKAQPIPLPPLTAYEAEVRHFVEAVARKGAGLRATIEDAVKTTALLEAEERSLESKAPVRVER